MSADNPQRVEVAIAFAVVEHHQRKLVWQLLRNASFAIRSYAEYLQSYRSTRLS